MARTRTLSLALLVASFNAQGAPAPSPTNVFPALTVVPAANAEHVGDLLRHRLLAVVWAGETALSNVTLRCEGTTVKMVSVQPTAWPLAAHGWAPFYVILERPANGPVPKVTLGVPEAPSAKGTFALRVTKGMTNELAVLSQLVPAIFDATAPRGVARPKPGPVGPRLPLRPITARDGVLYYADGGEVVLWGIGYSPTGGPSYAQWRRSGLDPRRVIDQDLEDFGAMGVDVLRVQLLEAELTDARGNLVDNEHLALLDYLVATSTTNGLYVMVTPMSGAYRGSTAILGSYARQLPTQALSMWAESWPFQTNYLSQLLLHTNRYTGRRLADEPCVAAWELMHQPAYWTFPNVESDPVASEPLAAVREAWRQFAPNDFRTQPVFALFQYGLLRQYLAAMCEAIRSTGSRAPIAAATTGPREAGNAPVTDSPVEAVTYAFHTGVGFPTTPTNDTQNLLIQTGEWDLAPRFQAKAKLSSGFDAPGMAEGVWMYPALARTFRFKETQMLPLSQYDTRALAPLNLEVPSHYLNLWHTPEKTVSFMIGGEAARWLARRATNLLTADDQVFAPFAVSFSRNAALMCAEDCYMQARPTDWRPLPLPTRPKRIVAVGSTPFWEYPGTGIVLFQDQGETATLRVYPDVLKSQRLRVSLVGTLDEPLTRLQETEHPFQLKLEGWTSVSVQRQEAGRWVPLPGTTANVLLRPGTYRLVKRDTAAK